MSGTMDGRAVDLEAKARQKVASGKKVYDFSKDA